MRLAISQSNYIPWKGYFDLIASVDRFVFYDTVQYTKNDWRNRNLIKTPNGLTWLTIPVGSHIHRSIQEVALPASPWKTKHWKSIEAAYRKAPHFDAISAWLRPMYLERSHATLSAFNIELIARICRHLNIATELVLHDGQHREHDRVRKLIEICRRHGAHTYVSAPAARQYIDPQVFAESGIALHWFDYDGYPVYAQPHGAFVHQVSILDVLFHCGPQAEAFVKRTATSHPPMTHRSNHETA